MADNDTEKIKSRNLKILFGFVFCVMMVTLYLFFTVDSVVDKILLGVSVVGQLLTLVGCYFENKYVTEIGHCIFGIVVLLIALVGRSSAVLLINVCLLGLTLVSRKWLGNCMYNFDTTKVDVSIIKLYPDLPWDYVYLTIFMISLGRFGVAFYFPRV